MPQSASRLPQFIIAVTYPESFSIETFIEVCKQKDFFFVYILHDKDVDKEGKPKKTHYHLFIDFQTCNTRENVLDALGIAPNQWQRCRNAYGALRYFTHSEE